MRLPWSRQGAVDEENNNGGGNAVAEADTTSSHSRPQPHREQSPVPEVAPVTGAVGFIGESLEKAEEAATAFKRHPVEDGAHGEKDLEKRLEGSEKEHENVIEHNGTRNELEGATEPGAASGASTAVEGDAETAAAVAAAETAEKGEKGADDDDDNVEYPGGLQLGLLTFGLCLATFVIIATAIPKITTVFDSLGDVGWYGSSYLLTTTALQPSFGRIYTYFNVKWTYIFALCLFEVGSIICAAATDSVMLIVGRAVAGAGASALFSGGMTIVGFTVPLRKRPLYIAALSSMFGISSVVGPLLGGALTDRATWRWCFWINLPFGGVAIATVFFFFKHPPRKRTNLTVRQKILELDLVGAFFLITAIVCLLLALQWGGSTYPWHDSKVWGCILGFGLLIAVFIGQQFRRGDRATIPPRILGQRTVLFSSLYSCFLSMGLYTHIYYLPFYFQAVKGTTAEGSGIRTIPYLVSIIISSIVIGGGITVIGIYKPFMIIGAAVFTVGSGMIYTFAVDTPTGRWIGYQILAGFGAGAGVQIPFVAIQVVLSNRDMATGNALAIFFNSLGGAISISIAQNIFSNGLYEKVPIYAPQISPQAVVSAGATYLREIIPADLLAGVLQAYMLSLNQSFVLPIAVGGISVICACFVEWKSVKGKKLSPVAA